MIFVAALSVFACRPPAALGFPALEELESRAGDGPEVLAALSAMRRDSLDEALERQREGGRYFINASYGYNDEPQYVGSTSNISYEKLTLGAGLSFPLFGTWNKLKINRLNAEIAAIDSKYRPQALALHNLAALRKAYAVLWIESQKIKLAKIFLRSQEEVTRHLNKRREAALLLEADNLEFRTAFDMAKRDIAVSNLRRVQALQVLRLATGVMWPMPEELPFPTLPVFEGAAADVAANPAVLMRQEGLEKYAKLVDVTKGIDRESTIIVGVTGSKEEPGDFGSGVYLGFSMSEPIKSVSSPEDKANLAARADYERAEREALFTRMKLEGEAEEALSYAAYASANIEAQFSRLRAISENVREKLLRHASLPGDTFEQLQSSRYQYYRVAADMLDSYLLFMESGADILSYAYPRGRDGEPPARAAAVPSETIEAMMSPLWLSGPSAAFAASPGTAKSPQNETKFLLGGVYVWEAAPFLSPASRGRALVRLKERGVKRMLISFTGKELRSFKNKEARHDLQAFLSEADAMGISPELLLGEPTWLYPENREKLILTIKFMSAFDFSGIHLDIEPDSLPGAAERRPKLLELLIDTIKESRRAAGRLPVSFSLHPRYLEGVLGKTLAEKLPASAVSYIAPMIYSTNAAGVAARMSAILLRFPQFDFVLAQSVEKMLSKSESYAAAGMDGFSAAMRGIDEKLAPRRNYKGIIVQDWKDYEVMR
ncbi:MAG: hypothetical protein Q4C86_06010 [bacterium]|nr:hypothetical protein [bacterium]